MSPGGHGPSLGGRAAVEAVSPAPRLVSRATRTALPDDWRDCAPPWVYDWPGGRPDQLGPFYLGSARLQISDTAQVQVTLHDPVACEAYYDYGPDDPDPESLTPEQKAGWERQRVRERRERTGRRERAALTLHVALADLNLELSTREGQPAGTGELVDSCDTNSWLNITAR